MQSVSRFPQIENDPPADYFSPVRKEKNQHIFEVQNPRTSLNDSEKDDSEGLL
jgi:hypothetical protein